MKKTLVIIVVVFICIVGLITMFPINSGAVRLADQCARATKECDFKPGSYMVVCEEGGAGYDCTYTCPYVLDQTDCERINY